MKLSRTLAAAAVLVASAISAQAAVTCSVNQSGTVNSTSWVVNPPKNFSDIVRNKLRLDAYAAVANGKVASNELPTAYLTCFGDDAAPNLIQKIQVVARDKKTGKDWPFFRSPLNKNSGAIDSVDAVDFDTVVTLP